MNGNRARAARRQADKNLFELHIALEMKVMVLDRLVGRFFATGIPPQVQEIHGFWVETAKAMKEKYPNLNLRILQPQLKPQPTLFVPDGHGLDPYGNGRKAG